jgi:hypothetical protein
MCCVSILVKKYSGKYLVATKNFVNSFEIHLKMLKDLFPSKDMVIEELYRNDAMFRSLCSDYVLCLQFLDKFRNEFSEKMVSMEEYELLKSELETELSNYLKK